MFTCKTVFTHTAVCTCVPSIHPCGKAHLCDSDGRAGSSRKGLYGGGVGDSGQRHLGHHGSQGLTLRHADDGWLGRANDLRPLVDNLVQQLASQLALLGDNQGDLAAAHTAGQGCNTSQNSPLTPIHPHHLQDWPLCTLPAKAETRGTNFCLSNSGCPLLRMMRGTWQLEALSTQDRMDRNKGI